jgi:hypothetical protein
MKEQMVGRQEQAGKNKRKETRKGRKKKGM